MEQINLYDLLPSRNIELGKLYLGWRAFTKVYVKKGTVLYNIKYQGYKPFSIDFVAPRDGFYVHNGLVVEHAKWFDWGHIDREPILCEFYESKEEFENGSQLVLTPPKYGTGFEDQGVRKFDGKAISNSRLRGSGSNGGVRRRYEDKSISNDSESCYTYLMRDESTGYYKIGMSKNPTYRERTLQCESPHILTLDKEILHKRRGKRAREELTPKVCS